MSERYYVYAIAGSAMHLPADIPRLGGSLLVLPYGELGAVVSRIHPAETEDTTSAISTENLLRHEAVVEAVCASGPALPVRYGTVLPDVDAVLRALAGQYDALRDDLQRVGGKVELGVTALWHPEKERSAVLASDPNLRRTSSADAVAEPRRPGLAYMRIRQTEYRRAQSARERALALGRELDAALRPCTIERLRSVCPSERLALRDVYLLNRERQNAFEIALTEIRQRHQEVRLLVSGPWPPYSFVTSPSRDATEILRDGDRAAGST